MNGRTSFAIVKKFGNAMMRYRRPLILGILRIVLIAVALVGAWIPWGAWPPSNPQGSRCDPEAIVILGGGDGARWRHGLEVAREHPELPVVVTGDGGDIVRFLRGNGVPWERIHHENAATSTVENAKFTKPILEKLGAKRVILVTNWFHQPRALAIFRKYQPDREFAVSFSPKPDPMSKSDRIAVRRERAAALHNLVFHGVWSW